MLQESGPNGPNGPTNGKHRPWSTREIREMQARPDWTAREVGEHLGRTEKAVRRARARFGRYRADAVPLCQRCHEHLTNTSDPFAAARCLCASCAADEKEWLEKNRDAMKRRDAARRQRKSRNRKRED